MEINSKKSGNGETKRIALVVSDFNDEITSRMEAQALQAAKQAGAQVVKIIHVPGAFDIPIAAAALARRPDVDAVATLGAVIKGETKHDEIVVRECARSLSAISIRANKPVSLGVIGPGATHAQAQARADEYAQRSVNSVLLLISSLKEARKQ
jgi:6,7-dimethyl-8-ribityllumazine synthase